MAEDMVRSAVERAASARADAPSESGMHGVVQSTSTSRGKMPNKRRDRQDRKFAAERAAFAASLQLEDIDASNTAVVAKAKATIEQKKWLYRLASWPNLSQILFMLSIAIGGESWIVDIGEVYPDQMRLLYDYSFASMLGYSLSMFAETLRDRKLLSLTADFVILLLAVVVPTGLFLSGALISGPERAALWGPDYWAIFGQFV